MPKSGFYGWKLLGVLWVVLLVNLAFPAYGSTVINTYMAADLHLDREMLGLPYSIYLIMSGLPAPLGWVYDRFGTYNYCFYFIAVVCLAGVVLLITIRPPTRGPAKIGDLDAERG